MLEILTTPNPILRKKTKPVSKLDGRVLKLAEDMINTVKNKDMGLAAPQVGKSLRIFVAKLSENKPFEVFINPKIISKSKKLNTEVLPKEELFLEGCLSIPGIYALIARPYKITLEWQDYKGKKGQADFKGLAATVLQHECDHLEGTLFTDRAIVQKTKLYEMKEGELRELIL